MINFALVFILFLQLMGKGSLWCVDPFLRPNLLQAVKKTPAHIYPYMSTAKTGSGLLQIDALSGVAPDPSSNSNSNSTSSGSQTQSGNESGSYQTGPGLAVTIAGQPSRLAICDSSNGVRT